MKRLNRDERTITYHAHYPDPMKLMKADATIITIKPLHASRVRRMIRDARSTDIIRIIWLWYDEYDALKRLS